MSRLFNLPLKTSSSPKGIYTEDELHAVLTVIYIAIFLDTDPVKSYPLKQATKTVAEQLGKLIETSTRGLNGLFSGGGNRNDPISSHGTALLKSLSETGVSASDIAWNQVLLTAVTTVSTQGAAVGQPSISVIAQRIASTC